MKFFHIGDLHFGKSLHNVSLTETDQRYWVEQFVRKVDEYRPDAVVIAGDVYDTRDPAPEAMKLLDIMLTELSQRDVYVFVVPGNHDSAARLSHVSGLLESHKIYIAGELSRELTHVTVPQDTGDMTFWLMPYIFPKLVSDVRVLNRQDLSTYDAAARALLDAQDIDTSGCNVLVAHQNVLANGTAPEHSESETIVGGLGEIDYTAFDAFDYVALGHIHNAQRVGRETVRYAGCPLYYDFSEVNRSKALTMVTINSKVDIQIEKIDIPLLHGLLQESGTLEELLETAGGLQNKERFYIQCLLCDKHVPPHAMERLKEAYGETLVNIKRVIPEYTAPTAEAARSGKYASLGLAEQFGVFYQEQQEELLDEQQEQIVQMILEQQSRQSGDYIRDANDVPEADSQELIDALLAAMTEEDE